MRWMVISRYSKKGDQIKKVPYLNKKKTPLLFNKKSLTLPLNDKKTYSFSKKNKSYILISLNEKKIIFFTPRTFLYLNLTIYLTSLYYWSHQTCRGIRGESNFLFIFITLASFFFIDVALNSYHLIPPFDSIIKGHFYF